MRKRRKPLVILGMIAIAAGCFLALHSPNEPEYEGKPISYWVARAAWVGSNLNSNEVAQAVVAVRTIGTNGLPFLLEYVAYEPLKWKYSLVRQVPHWLPGGKPFATWLEGEKPAARYLIIVGAFRIIGSNASIAIPDLELIMNDTNRSLSAMCAFGALWEIGPPAFPALTNALANPAHPLHDQIGVSICNMASEFHDRGESPEPYVAIVRQLLHDPSTWVRTTASNVMGQLEGNVDASQLYPR